MGYITGKDGMVNGADTVRLWRIEPLSPGGPYAGSDAAGAMDRIDGWKDWKGQYAAYGHTPSSMPGTALSFVGSIDGSVGVYGTAIVEAVTIDIEIPQDEEQPPTPINHIVEFKANGTLSRGAAVAADADVPNVPNPKELKVEYATPAAVQSYTTLSSVYRARLRIACRNPLYRPGAGSGLTYRLAGNIDASLQMEMYESAATNLPTEGNNYGIKIYVTSTLFWYIDWMKLEGITPFEVPIETRKLVYANLDWALKSTHLIGVTPTRGSIKKPNTTTWWP